MSASAIRGHTDAPAVLAAVRLRSLCGPNPHEHPRNPANTVPADPHVSEPFARIRGYSRFLKAIGANGSSWLEHAVFSPAANVLQTPYHAQTGHRARRDRVYAILNARIMRPTNPLPGIRGRRSDGIEPRLYVLARRGHRSRALWHVLHPVSPERVRPPFGLCGQRRSGTRVRPPLCV